MSNLSEQRDRDFQELLDAQKTAELWMFDWLDDIGNWQVVPFKLEKACRFDADVTRFVAAVLRRVVCRYSQPLAMEQRARDRSEATVAFEKHGKCCARPDMLYGDGYCPMVYDRCPNAAKYLTEDREA